MRPKEQKKRLRINLIISQKLQLYLMISLTKEKKIMSELYDGVDYNNLHFEYVGPTKSVSFYGYMDSKELFNAIKNNQIKFGEVKNKQSEFLNKLSNIKIGKKTIEQKEVINNLEKFYNSKEEVINIFRDYIECYLMLITMQNKMKLKEQGLKY